MTRADPKTYLWANIETLMGGQRQTIDAVQVRTGVSRGTIQRIKVAKTSVGIDVLVDIANSLGVEIWELLNPSLSQPGKLPQPDALIPKKPNTRFLIEHFAAKLSPLDPVDRGQAKVILSSLTDQPEHAPELAAKLERLLGESPSGRTGNTQRAA